MISFRKRKRIRKNKIYRNVIKWSNQLFQLTHKSSLCWRTSSRASMPFAPIPISPWSCLPPSALVASELTVNFFTHFVQNSWKLCDLRKIELRFGCLFWKCKHGGLLVCLLILVCLGLENRNRKSVFIQSRVVFWAFTWAFTWAFGLFGSSSTLQRRTTLLCLLVKDLTAWTWRGLCTGFSTTFQRGPAFFCGPVHDITVRTWVRHCCIFVYFMQI